MHQRRIHELCALIIGEGAGIDEGRCINETGADSHAAEFKLIEQFGNLQTAMTGTIGRRADIGVGIAEERGNTVNAGRCRAFDMNMQFAARAGDRQSHKKLGPQRGFLIDAAIAGSLIGANDRAFKHRLFHAGLGFNAFRLRGVGVSRRCSQKKGHEGRCKCLGGQHFQLRRVANFCN